MEQACGEGSGGSEGHWRGPLVASEHRGCASPTLADGLPQGDENSTRAVENLKGTAKRRKRSWVKSRPVGRYAVGDDTEWDKVLAMSQRTLVGRVMGRNFARKTVVDWVDENWREILGYAPVVDMLLRGWFAVVVNSEEDMRRILNKNWHLNHSPVLLKPWHPLFDASRERIDKIPIWVRLPGLPLHF